MQSRMIFQSLCVSSLTIYLFLLTLQTQLQLSWYLVNFPLCLTFFSFAIAIHLIMSQLRVLWLGKFMVISCTYFMAFLISIQIFLICQRAERGQIDWGLVFLPCWLLFFIFFIFACFVTPGLCHHKVKMFREVSLTWTHLAANLLSVILLKCRLD